MNEQLAALIEDLRLALDVENAAEMDAREAEKDHQDSRRRVQQALYRAERAREATNAARYVLHARCEAMAQSMFEGDNEIARRSEQGDYDKCPPDQLRIGHKR